MGMALPKIFNDPTPESDDRLDAANDAQYNAANDDHYGHNGHHKKKSTGSKMLKKGLKFAFSMAVGAAIGFTTGVFLDLYLIDAVHYPNEAMQTAKNLMLHYGQPLLETLGISGDGGLLHWLFNQETVASAVAPFAPASVAATTTSLGTGATADAAAQAVVEAASGAANDSVIPPAIDLMQDMMQSNGL